MRPPPLYRELTWLFSIATLLVFGCHHRQTVKQPAAILACSPSMALPRPEDVCNGMFTNSGLACVHCAAAACIDRVDSIYCIKGSDCGLDPLCVHLDATSVRNSHE
jgi:hypothetical protein